MRNSISPVDEVLNLSRLPYIDESMRYSSTSYDREGYNVDYDQRLYIDENGDQVLMDVKGSGCVYKLFLPTVYYPDKDFLNVYIDDCSLPVISGSIQDIFSGKISYIPSELVEINVPEVKGTVRQSGYIIYMPIPFSKRIKITTTADSGQLFYYHIDYVVYPPETIIESYSTRQDNSLLVNAMKNGLDICGEKKDGILDLACGETKAFFGLKDTTAQISCLRFKVDKIYASGGEAQDYLRLNGLRLKIFFDEELSPSVDAPFSGLFGFPVHGIDPNSPDYRTKCLAFGMSDDGWLYLKFSMPFKKSVDIQIENVSCNPKIHLQYEVYTSEFKEERKWGYFKAKQIQLEGKENDKNDMRFLELNGSGRFVGIVSSMDTNVSPEKGDYLEGDEHIYIDGHMSPQVNGTGTEDFYNGAFYWCSGTLSRPFYGCGYNSKWKHGSIACTNDKTYKSMAYRLMTGDSITFRRKLVFDMEHGPINHSYEKVDSVLFYYLNDEASLCETDQLSVFEEESREKHSYKSKFAMPLTCTSAFEGLCDGEEHTYKGHLLTKGGSSEFQLDIAEKNTFVILRRLFDYSYENQAAEVYVDGIFCGIWYDAGSNGSMRLRESEFRLPVRVTENKKQITIEIKPISSQWSVCHYKIFCNV